MSACIECDGITVVNFTGSFDPLVAIATLISVYYVYNLAPSSGFVESFSFYESLIFKLNSNTTDLGYKLIADIYNTITTDPV